MTDAPAEQSHAFYDSARLRGAVPIESLAQVQEATDALRSERVAEDR